MELYLVRHGEAVPAEIDSKRPLTEAGLGHVRELGRLLVEKNTKVNRIFHSGILRAEQTAEVLAEALLIKDIVKLPGLTPEDDPEPLLSLIDQWDENTLLVGHLPYLAYLAYLLIPQEGFIDFRPATGVGLQRQTDGWRLVFQQHTADV